MLVHLIGPVPQVGKGQAVTVHETGSPALTVQRSWINSDHDDSAGVLSSELLDFGGVAPGK